MDGNELEKVSVTQKHIVGANT